MIGNSEAMKQLIERVRAASRVGASILVMGETGSGKELVARSIHDNSSRNTGRFVAVDCGALPEDLIESELFGYRRGAFTTAMTDKPGLFEMANGGTLFLDEIANTSRRFQAKLLRALQEREIRRLGDVNARPVDIRVIAATNCDLRRLIQRGEFREDLFYRLNVFSIQVPPLRDRLDDIPMLTEFILQGRRRISRNALLKLQSYGYPGNVRELENIVESAIYTGESDTIEDRDIILPDETLYVSQTEFQIDNFWESIARPYAERHITKDYVEQVIRKGLVQAEGSYRRLVRLFNLPPTDYKRFMDFIRRHHCNVDYRPYRRKPDRK